MSRGRGKALVMLGGLFAFLAAMGRPRKARGATVSIGPIKVDTEVSKNFKRSEFLHSAYAPDLIRYEPTQAETERLRRHVQLQLQPLRNDYGRIVITSGARPDSVPAKGPKSGRTMTITEAMIEAGDDAVPTSDHRNMVFGVSDFALVDAKPSQWVEAYDRLRRDPNTRQVILYFVTDRRTGKLTPDHIHLSTVQPGFPPLHEPWYAFVNVDGKASPQFDPQGLFV